jgi:hypothetical protein
MIVFHSTAKLSELLLTRWNPFNVIRPSSCASQPYDSLQEFLTRRESPSLEMSGTLISSVLKIFTKAYSEPDRWLDCVFLSANADLFGHVGKSSDRTNGRIVRVQMVIVERSSN